MKHTLSNFVAILCLLAFFPSAPQSALLRR